MAFGSNRLLPPALRPQAPSLGNIGYVPPQPAAPDPNRFAGLDFLNHPDGGGGGGGQAQSYAQSPEPSSYGAPTDIGTVTPPDKILETSPEWLAYINALGLQKGQFAADIARQREIAGANFKLAREAIGPQYQEQRRGITSSAEGQGMARSGMLQRNLATSRGAESRANADIYSTLSNTLSDLQSSLAQKNLELDAQRSQQQATMLSSGYKSNGLYDYLNSLPKSG